MIIQKSDQVSLTVPLVDHHLGAMHDIALPDVVGLPGLELSSVLGYLTMMHQIVLMQHPVDSGKTGRVRDQSAAFEFGQ